MDINTNSETKAKRTIGAGVAGVFGATNIGILGLVFFGHLGSLAGVAVAALMLLVILGAEVYLQRYEMDHGRLQPGPAGRVHEQAERRADGAGDAESDADGSDGQQPAAA